MKSKLYYCFLLFFFHLEKLNTLLIKKEENKDLKYSCIEKKPASFPKGINFPLS